jgi:UDP-galactopyranose mutase
MAKYDSLVVGAGIFGLTIAERLANQKGQKVLVIDSRNHIGGNAYSEFDKTTGIECHKYGAHLFHTSDEKVWRYVNQFTTFTNYVHKVYTTHKGEVFPMPINLGTINQFLHDDLTPDEARHWVNQQAGEFGDKLPTNLTEQGIKLIGKPLFEAFIKNYTAKQWQTPAEKLSASIIKRLPVRYNYNNSYFSDSYEGLPTEGYNAWFKRMIDSGKDGQGSITIKLNTDFFKDDNVQKLRHDKIITIYTGPIDRYFDYQFGELSWRSLDLKKEIVDTADFQGCPVMNYADLAAKFTRIHEFKHFHPERAKNPKKWPGYADNYQKTVIVREYSKDWLRDQDEPYYPVSTADDKAKLAKYQQLAKQETNVYFGGRLGEYAYYDMDKTFASALELFDVIKTN